MLVNVCNDAAFILRVVVKIVKIVQLLIPILLIVLVTFDIFKAVAGQADDKAKKEMSEKLVKRIIYAVIIFLIPVIVDIVFRRLDPLTNSNHPAISTDSTSWISCWNQYYHE